ncbi:hypothetical protein ACIA98_40905 [Streptomyces sp. NPDC051366]|uniref:hypothetical protein n=1 Tax=Streptomyces sp. NPDC051366 TaxID=3365652 RepID=UPI00379188A1
MTGGEMAAGLGAALALHSVLDRAFEGGGNLHGAVQGGRGQPQDSDPPVRPTPSAYRASASTLNSEPQDRILIHTDGVIDARSASGELFGE